MSDPSAFIVGMTRRDSSRRAPTEVDRVLATQRGLITRNQAIQAGLSKRTIQRRLESATWERVLPCVYRLPSAPSTWIQLVTAAHLWAGEGAVVSHRAAAALLKLDGFEEGPAELTLPRRVRPPSLDVVLHYNAVPRGDIQTSGPLEVTNATRTLIDLASVADMDTLEIALESALRRGVTSLTRLRWRMEQPGTRGRPGAAALRRLLLVRGSPARPGESPLEVRLLQLIRRSGLPEPVRQFELREGPRVLARLDLAYPQALVCIECDGYTYHSGRAIWQRDLRRGNAVTARGWSILHVTWADLRERPGEMLAEIEESLARAAPPPL